MVFDGEFMNDGCWSLVKNGICVFAIVYFMLYLLGYSAWCTTLLCDGVLDLVFDGNVGVL